MEGTAKVSEREEGHIAEKLKRGALVGLRGGPCTPPPTWRLELLSHSPLPSSSSTSSFRLRNRNVREFLDFPPSAISARKLCASLWEFQAHQIQTPLPQMPKPHTGIRRRRRRRRKDDIPPSVSDEPASASSLSGHVAISPVQHRRSVERNGCAQQQPESPASYSGSMEVAPYNRVATLTSSLDFKGRRMGESSNLKTSKELLKILNRIWSLEEQHASSISVVKTQKMELDLSRARVKELLREKQMNRREMEDLMKHMTEDKLVRKNSKENHGIKAALQSVQEELEDERSLRKHSESLHRKLARELSDVKSSFSCSLRELERERKARILLENLCDEFAKGIRAYEQEVRSHRRLKAEKGQVGGGHSVDRLILHISEAWLDERMQMKLAEAGNDLDERNSIVDKLGFDIESFLHARRSTDSKKYSNSPKDLKEIYPCRHSLDSFPLKEFSSAPRNMADEDSTGTKIFSQKMASGGKASSRLQKSNTIEVHQEEKGSRNSMRKQVESEEFTEACELAKDTSRRSVSCDDSENWFVEKKLSEMRGDNNTCALNDPAISTVCEATQGMAESNQPGTEGMSLSHWRDNLVGNSSLSSEGDKVHPECICREESCVTGNVSHGVEQWKSKSSVPELYKSESFSKLARGVKENTLMAKLLEARLEGQKCRAKTCKSSVGSSKQVSGEKIEM